MKAKYFQTFDPVYHKKVEAVNIILTPEEKEKVEAGLSVLGDSIEIGPKLKSFLRPYKPYEPENEHKEFPDGAFNMVIFEDMYLKGFLDFVYLVSEIGELHHLLDSYGENRKISNELIESQKDLLSLKDETYKLLVEVFRNVNLIERSFRKILFDAYKRQDMTSMNFVSDFMEDLSEFERKIDEFLDDGSDEKEIMDRIIVFRNKYFS